ncbi:MAG: Prolipoprotein diacylglyceryl transferase [Microgenomates group bacterium ADurb.Bin219]|nr:MAG: Prolipoprotein diacylglyceryl transferase [Microgenomates group bacterium ADurb.Bin219]HNP89358.1 prolipoprotein diacylglyceryl transferase [Candidatus Woesebacteria bacterium]
MRQSYSFGPFHFYYYGLFISLGIVAGYLLAKIRLKRFNFSSKDLDYFLFFLFPSCLLGARIYHVLSSLPYYSLFPQEILLINRGGLGIYGAIISGLIALIILAKIKKKPLISVLDLFSLPLLITQSIARLGNYFNYEVIGPPSQLPWAFYVPLENRPIIFSDSAYFHPVFLYESLFCLIFSFFLFILERKIINFPGFSFGFYLVSYGTTRYFLEFLRFDTWVIGELKVAQGISLFFIATGLYLITNGIRKQKLVK